MKIGLDKHSNRLFMFCLLLALLAGCAVPPPPTTPTVEATASAAPTRMRIPTRQPEATLTPTPIGVSLSLPLRAALYYPQRADNWNDLNLKPARGVYDSGDPAVIAAQMAEMLSVGIRAGAVLLDDPAWLDDLAGILDAARGESFYWGAFLDLERERDPSTAEIERLMYDLSQEIAAHPNAWRFDGRMVLVLDVDEVDDGCGMVSRWQEANRKGAFFLIMQAFPGYDRCGSQPDMWIDLYPDTPIEPRPDKTRVMLARSWDGRDLPALERSLRDWGEQVSRAGSLEDGLQLVRSYNDWQGGMNLEAASVLGTVGEYYLETLRRNGKNYAALLDQVLGNQDAVLVGAGDIAICGSAGSQETAALLDQIPGIVFTAGDNSNEDGSSADYSQCFDPTWGRHKQRIYPAVGNHDMLTSDGAPYYTYFGKRAGDPGKGYYSFDLGGWQILVLNSVCEYAGGCGEDSPQMVWLNEQLQSRRNLCTLAIWHYPLYTSGARGSNEVVRPFWQALHAAGAEIIINGHDHHYERFAPMDAAGQVDIERGIRQFIVGTGGAGLRGIGEVAANSQKRILYTYGVLKLILQPNGYLWEF
ncbi:MAG: metallophosphoesterase, partial [Chloroflexota bacterium]